MVDTIKTHRRKLVAPYRSRRNAARVIASAKRLAHVIISSDELLHSHSTKMLKEVLWLLTEADGKYSTRYRSAEVVRLAQENPESNAQVRHEHVYPRAVVAREILGRRQEFREFPDRLDELLEQKAVACIVTVLEHGQLQDDAEGWRRYVVVPVLDMSANPPVLRRHDD